MVQAGEGCKVMHTNSNGLTTPHSQPAETYTLDTNDFNYATSTRQRKAESTLLARLALAGHVVHKGRCDDYTVCKYGYAHYCQDIAELHAFAVRLGVCDV
jgi:hypothetical protein